jgi:hypothetical protein
MQTYVSDETIEQIVELRVPAKAERDLEVRPYPADPTSRPARHRLSAISRQHRTTAAPRRGLA